MKEEPESAGGRAAPMLSSVGHMEAGGTFRASSGTLQQRLALGLPFSQYFQDLLSQTFSKGPTKEQLESAMTPEVEVKSYGTWDSPWSQTTFEKGWTWGLNKASTSARAWGSPLKEGGL